MGLDQMMFAVTPHADNTDFSYSNDCKYHQFGSWRKHPYLQGWMEKMFNFKADAQGFEGEVDLSGSFMITGTQLEGGAELSEAEIEEALSSDKEMRNKIMQENFMHQANYVGKKREFNRQCIRLNVGDLDQLEMAVKLGELPPTTGFFFGEDSSEHYKEQDLKVIEIAREAIKHGLDVYYDSWW